ncbi:class I SAM-dependent methyltransferase [Leifsonia poae]|uniref:class I SAM-dependent methyltransferase n=1 Tax=Leifsonia poae TaxID=110933 RepID=UPI001CBD7597|nr:methyltransferase domain-containing protein [Leifsonia poae]
MNDDELYRAVRERFDERASDYDDSAMHRGLAVAVADFVDLAGVEAVLDVATGTGLVLRTLESRASAEGLRLTGIDISPGMLAVARLALPSAVLVEAPADRLPLDDDTIDLITCVTGLHLFPHPQAAFAEWVRVLRPGGRVVTATFQESDPRQHGGDQRPAAPALPRNHDAFRTPEALDSVARPAGLTLRRHETWTHGQEAILVAELTL